MMAALWVSKTGLAAQDLQLSTISNNLANVSTSRVSSATEVYSRTFSTRFAARPGAQSSENTTIPSGLQLGTGVAGDRYSERIHHR